MRPGAASSLLLIDGGGSQGVLRDSHGITAPQFWGPWADTSPSGLTWRNGQQRMRWLDGITDSMDGLPSKSCPGIEFL